MRDLAQEFVALGHSLTMIVPDATLDKPWRISDQAGVRVIRLAAEETRAESLVRRGLAEAFLPFRMLWNYRRSPLASETFDHIAWYSPPVFFGPLIWWLKRRSNGRAYLILRDIFPEWMVDLGLMRKGPVYYGFKAVVAFQYWVSDTIGVQTSSNLPYVQDWEKAGRRKIEVLTNWLAADAGLPCRIQIAQTPLAGRIIFVYIGNMGVAQGVDILLDLARALTSRGDIGFLFVGRGSEFGRLSDQVVAESLDNVIFHDEIDSREIPTLLAQCHVGLLALDPRHKSHNIPGKFISYMRYGLPTLGRLNPGTDLARMIAEYDVGRAVSGEVVEPLVVFAEELANDADLRTGMSARAKALNEAYFLPSVAVQQILAK